MTAALSGKQVKNVAFRRKSLPTHDDHHYSKSLCCADQYTTVWHMTSTQANPICLVEKIEAQTALQLGTLDLICETDKNTIKEILWSNGRLK